ncbi:potassium transporter [Coprinopsis cinerea AmutBmut pab1-1]|nr:potassium transporter [Coprinopsis cinerea AmutBmut pab1-1]
MADLAPVTDSEHDSNRGLWRRCTKHLNFYRIHILVFTFTPLFFSVIFYLSNGEVKISYVDSLFNCVSSMAVCGLATVDLSSLTPWQQVILFIQMCIGNPIVVSWLIVFSRKRYIERRCSNALASYIDQREKVENVDMKKRSPWARFMRSLGFLTPNHSVNDTDTELGEKPRAGRSIDPANIRRLEAAPRPVNPSGQYTDQDAYAIEITPPTERNSPVPLSRESTPSSSSAESSTGMHPVDDYDDPTASEGPGLPRTVTFQESEVTSRIRHRTGKYNEGDDIVTEHLRSEDPGTRQSSNQGIPRTMTHQSTRPSLRTYTTNVSVISQAPRKNQGFGGFPMPWTVLSSLFHWLFPDLGRKLHRTITMPVTATIASGAGSTKPGPSYIIPDDEPVIVGKNSDVQASNSQLKNLAYHEYKALILLLWIIAFYHVGVQLIGFAIAAPYISTSRWKEAFVPPQLVRPVNSVWFSAFQTVSAYTNTGSSLVDQSMLPFQSAYVLILVMIFLIYAGNTCFPIFLRFVIYCLWKLTGPTSRVGPTLEFLLDHPRRCYIYLFPSHQTWFLLTVVIGLTLLDWIFFLILDIGNAVLDEIPTNIKVLDGFMQAVAVRAAGFSIVPLAAIAPAVKVLYVVMMYISVYPIAMSVRSTNVYEANSLGIFPELEDEEENEENFNNQGPRVQVWGRYLMMHIRQQLSFDMWWIVLAIFLICIVESGNLQDPAKSEWFTIFNLLFELVSAYGIVGLSLGIPDGNYSFSGALRPLSKLIICVVMIRGRHRGLPVAIDRAVLFPKEFRREQLGADNFEDGVSLSGLTASMDQDQDAASTGYSRSRLSRHRTLSQTISVQRSPTQVSIQLPSKDLTHSPQVHWDNPSPRVARQSSRQSRQADAISEITPSSSNSTEARIGRQGRPARRSTVDSAKSTPY